MRRSDMDLIQNYFPVGVRGIYFSFLWGMEGGGGGPRPIFKTVNAKKKCKTYYMYISEFLISIFL